MCHLRSGTADYTLRLVALPPELRAVLRRRTSPSQYQSQHHRFEDARLRPAWHRLASASSSDLSAFGATGLALVHRTGGNDTSSLVLCPGWDVFLCCGTGGVWLLGCGRRF